MTERRSGLVAFTDVERASEPIQDHAHEPPHLLEIGCLTCGRQRVKAVLR